VVNGFDHKKGIEYDEIFSPVVKMTSIRAILSIVATQNLFLEQLDVKIAFLHGDLEEEIYMHVDKIYFLNKEMTSIAFLYLKFDTFMVTNEFVRCQSDHCVYVKRTTNGNYLILLLYVDDMLVAGSSM